MEEWVSLQDIYTAYIECRKRKRNTKSCNEFELYEAENLYSLYEELNNKTYKIGKSITFCVTRPKIREIFAADFKDRIVHHLIIQRIGNLFENYFVHDTYNCRKKKGTLYGHKRVHQFSQEYETGWVFSGDIKSFFMSIPKNILAAKLNKFIKKYYKGKDIKEIQWLVKTIVLHEPENCCVKRGDHKLWEYLPKDKSLFTCGKGYGMAIGNLTSQIFANFYLSDFDRFIARNSEIRYCRYVDDFRIFAKDKNTILNLIPVLRKYLKDNLQLTLHPKKIELQPVRHGLSFTGAIIKPYRMYTGKRTLGNFVSLLRSYNCLNIKQFDKYAERFVSRCNSYLGYLKQYKTFKYRYRAWKFIKPWLKQYITASSDLSVYKVLTKYKYRTILKLKYYDYSYHRQKQIQISRKACRHL